MPDSSDRSEKRSGIVTERDRDWLEGNKSGDSAKSNLRLGIAYAMEDLKYLINLNTETVTDPPLDGLGDLFTRLESDAGMTHQDCSKYLIALAFIIANEPIDYQDIVEDVVLHERESGESPTDENRNKKGGSVYFSQPIDDILAFRQALTSGIGIGKKRIESQDGKLETSLPDTVLIDSNTKLYQEPTKHRIKPEDQDLSEGFLTSDWKDALAAKIDADTPSENTSQSDRISQEQAIRHIQTEIGMNIESRLTHRRVASDYDIIRHGSMPSGVPDSQYKGEVEITNVEQAEFTNRSPQNTTIPLEFTIEQQSKTLGGHMVPKLALTVSNNTKEVVYLRGSAPTAFLSQRTSNPESLLLLTDPEYQQADLEIDNCVVTNYDPFISSSDVTHVTLEPDYSRTHTLYLVVAGDDHDSSPPQDGEYRFDSTYSVTQNSQPSQAGYDELTWGFTLEIES